MAATEETEHAVPPEALLASRRFLGEWNQLVSTTNWEKGRIICGWRAEMIAAGASPRDYSDEVWAAHVHQVSPQHVGRLRRTYDRFGKTYRSFSGLYWTHFCTALEWDDAEKWLAEARENRWSVNQMRTARNEELGLNEPNPPEGVPLAELDEDTDTAETQFQPLGEEAPFDTDEHELEIEPTGEPTGVETESPDDGSGEEAVPSLTADQVARVRPFEQLPELPEDLTEAVELFKVAIVRHRMQDWEEVAPDDVLMALDSLKTLVLAPREE